MNTLAPWLLGAVLGAGVTLVCVWPFGDVAAPPVRADEAPPAPTGSPDATEQLERIEHAVGRLAAKVERLEARIETAIERTTQRSPAAGPAAGTAPLAIDEAAMQRALEGALDSAAQRQLRDKYDKLTPETMLAEVRRLQYESKDPTAARQALDLLLERNLDPQQRAKAQIQLGILQRNGDETAAAEATLRGVVQSQGLNSDVGADAGYQLIWTVWKRDRREALGIADGVARDAPTEGGRIHARWSAAMLAHELNDLGRARADYAAILRDCEGRAEFAGIVKDVRQRLSDLDRK